MVTGEISGTKRNGVTYPLISLTAVSRVDGGATVRRLFILAGDRSTWHLAGEEPVSPGHHVGTHVSPVFRTPAPTPPTNIRETTMSGEFDQAKGRVKQAAGDLTDDDEMRREGEADESAGKVKEKLDDAKDKLDDAVDKVRDKLD